MTDFRLVARPPRRSTRYAAGWRDIGATRAYFRSKWEANYARYLEWMRGLGRIERWEHEPETFWFESIRRGVRSYLPDFRVTYPDGCVEYHEVKGRMDQRSRTKLERMAKYYPDVTVVVIGPEWFRANAPVLCGVCEGWE